MMIGRTISGEKKYFTLSDEELFEAYKEQELSFAVHDVELELGSQGHNYEEFTKNEIKVMAEDLIDVIDCNIPYNDQLENIVNNFIEE